LGIFFRSFFGTNIASHVFDDVSLVYKYSPNSNSLSLTISYSNTYNQYLLHFLLHLLSHPCSSPLSYPFFLSLFLVCLFVFHLFVFHFFSFCHSSYFQQNKQNNNMERRNALAEGTAADHQLRHFISTLGASPASPPAVPFDSEDESESEDSTALHYPAFSLPRRNSALLQRRRMAIQVQVEDRFASDKGNEIATGGELLLDFITRGLSLQSSSPSPTHSPCPASPHRGSESASRPASPLSPSTRSPSPFTTKRAPHSHPSLHRRQHSLGQTPSSTQQGGQTGKFLHYPRRSERRNGCSVVLTDQFATPGAEELLRFVASC